MDFIWEIIKRTHQLIRHFQSRLNFDELHRPTKRICRYKCQWICTRFFENRY